MRSLTICLVCGSMLVRHVSLQLSCGDTCQISPWFKDRTYIFTKSNSLRLRNGPLVWRGLPEIQVQIKDKWFPTGLYQGPAEHCWWHQVQIQKQAQISGVLSQTEIINEIIILTWTLMITIWIKFRINYIAGVLYWSASMNYPEMNISNSRQTKYFLFIKNISTNHTVMMYVYLIVFKSISNEDFRPFCSWNILYHNVPIEAQKAMIASLLLQTKMQRHALWCY